jgi:uncharacterized damage-inducible protein DinB
MSNQEFFIATWKKEMPLTINCLRKIPENKWDWRPHEKTRSAKQLLDHLTSHAEDLVEGVQTGVINHRVLANYASVEEAVEAFEEQSQKLLDLVAGTSDAAWNETKVPLLVFGNKVGEDSMGGMCWTFLHDIIHHRGQLSVYLRPMGVVNSYIYGPTAEMIEAMAAQTSAAN